MIAKFKKKKMFSNYSIVVFWFLFLFLVYRVLLFFCLHFFFSVFWYQLQIFNAYFAVLRFSKRASFSRQSQKHSVGVCFLSIFFKQVFLFFSFCSFLLHKHHFVTYMYTLILLFKSISRSVNSHSTQILYISRLGNRIKIINNIY